MNSDQLDRNNKTESYKEHSKLRPSKNSIPFLAEKLDYLFSQLGITQQYLADQIGVESCAISQWKTNGIPKIRIVPLCKYLGIGREELEIADIPTFYASVHNRYNKNIGTRWRLHTQNRSVTGLQLDVIATPPRMNITLKAIYRKPQPISVIMHMPRVTVNDSVRFKLPATNAQLPNGEDVESLLLFVEDPTAIQLLTPEMQEPHHLINNGFYTLPNDGGEPYYIGLPTGKYCAYLVLLAANPPNELWQTFAEKPDGYSADVLASWLIEEKVTHKINVIEFLVNI